MNQLGNITLNAETERNGCSYETPKDPYKFATSIQYAQDVMSLQNMHTILFNKGRYFETSIQNEDLREFVANYTDLKIEYANMIVGRWDKMETFVQAMNERGYYVRINIDWI